MDETINKRRLIWKYFFQQKIKEIGKGILYLIGIALILGLFLVGLFGFAYFMTWLSNYLGSNPLAEEITKWVIIIVFGGLVLLGLIIATYEEWLKPNWEKAKRRVEEEYGK